MSNDLLLILPELILVGAGLLALLAAAYLPRYALGVAQGIGLAALAIVAVWLIVTIDSPPEAVFSNLLVIDSFAGYAKILIALAAALCLYIAPRFFGATMRAEYSVLILFAVLGMSLMVSAVDMLALYVGLELSSLASYVLASFRRDDARSSEAGLKYFVLGGLASGILLYGISLLYGFAGTTSYVGIAEAFAIAASAENSNLGLLFGLVFVLVGMAFKIGAVPFHMWIPDVYEGAPTAVTAFFASAPKIAAIMVMVRATMGALGSAQEAWLQIIIFMSLASIIIGAVGAIGQRNIKRLLAYSSINNVGFILIGLAAAGAGVGGAVGAGTGSPASAQTGIVAVLVYVTIYLVMTLGAFLLVLQIRDSKGTHVEEIPRLAGLYEHSPWFSAALGVFLFSLAGVPPMFGFWAKYMVFAAAMEAGLTMLAVVGIVASVVGAFVYIAMVKRLFFDAPPSAQSASLATQAETPAQDSQTASEAGGGGEGANRGEGEDAEDSRDNKATAPLDLSVTTPLLEQSLLILGTAWLLLLGWASIGALDRWAELAARSLF